jgi:hypothetical protein
MLVNSSHTLSDLVRMLPGRIVIAFENETARKIIKQELFGCDRLVYAHVPDDIVAAGDMRRAKKIQSEIRRSELDSVVMFKGGMPSSARILSEHAILVNMSSEGCIGKIMDTPDDPNLLNNIFKIDCMKKRMIKKLRQLD